MNLPTFSYTRLDYLSSSIVSLPSSVFQWDQAYVCVKDEILDLKFVKQIPSLTIDSDSTEHVTQQCHNTIGTSKSYYSIIIFEIEPFLCSAISQQLENIAYMQTAVSVNISLSFNDRLGSSI